MRDFSDSLGYFERVYAENYQDVYSAVRGVVIDSALAEDVTQDAFTRAFKSYDRDRPSVTMSGWLHMLAIRAAISRLRWLAVRQRLLWRRSQVTSDAHSDSEEGDLVLSLLAELNPQTRACLMLRVRGLPHAQIAAVLGVPSAAVAVHISQGLQRMQMAPPEVPIERAGVSPQ